MNSQTLFAQVVNKYYQRARDAQFELSKDRLTPTKGAIRPLTKRELEMGYYFVIKGLTLSQTAEELVVSLKTVEMHLVHFRFKCGLSRSRVWRMVADYWYQAGQLELSPPSD